MPDERLPHTLYADGRPGDVLKTTATRYPFCTSWVLEVPVQPTKPTPRLTVDRPDKVPRQDTHVTTQGSPEGPGISPQTPDSMPRAEDDEWTRAHSPEFHDRPGSGKHTADRQQVF